MATTGASSPVPASDPYDADCPKLSTSPVALAAATSPASGAGAISTRSRLRTKAERAPARRQVRTRTGTAALRPAPPGRRLTAGVVNTGGSCAVSTDNGRRRATTMAMTGEPDGGGAPH